MRALFRSALLALALLMTAALAQQQLALPGTTVIGSGTFRWFGLTLYEATLFAERDSFNANNWATTPLALELAYTRTLAGDKIAVASADEIKKLGLGNATQLRAWEAAMKQLFPNVTEGTRLTGVYRPGQPTRFLLNGDPLGEIADHAFGPAFFAIWLHPETSAPKLRSALLGKR
jgi:hypothetical protein